MLWLEPVLRQLSKRYRKVYLYTHFFQLFENLPCSNVVVRKIPSGSFRILLKLLNFFSLQKKYHRLDGYCYEAFPKMHFLNAYQNYFGEKLTREYPKLYLSEIEKSKTLISGKYVVLHLSASLNLNFRKVYGVNWNNIVAFFSGLNMKTIIVGHQEAAIDGAEVFNGSIRELMQVIKDASLFIGIDSGPSHIAASLRIPSLVFFGSVNPEYRHFKELFNGKFLQQYCEYAFCYHEVIGGAGQTCKLVGDGGVPKCCIHSDEIVLEAVKKILK